jgi:curved DNA-binding protein CbpA
MINYYKLLQISQQATAKEIQSAYRLRAREYHPDKLNGLGQELQNLGASKIILINEAYRVLKNQDSRQNYNQKLQNNQEDLIYVVCRSCGHTEAINPEDSQLENCPVCQSSMKIPTKASFSSDFPWLSLLHFLADSHQVSHNRELPNSIYCKFDHLFFTIDQLLDGRFCLFTHFKMMHSQMERLFPDLSSPWDNQCEAGFIILGQNLATAGENLKRIANYFDPKKIELYFNPGERGGAIHEPNVAFLSALCDISFASANLMWKQSSYKLNNCALITKAGWEGRIMFTIEHLYGKVRERDSSNSTSDNTAYLHSVSNLKNLLQNQIQQIDELFPQI